MKKDNMSAKQYICYGIIIAVAGGLIIKYFEYLIDNDLKIKNFFFTFEINYLSLILILMLFAIALYISYKKSSRKKSKRRYCKQYYNNEDWTIHSTYEHNNVIWEIYSYKPHPLSLTDTTPKPIFAVEKIPLCPRCKIELNESPFILGYK